MKFTYAIPDLHGRSDLLDSAIGRINAHAAGQGGTVVMLGDYVNKGPDTRGVIERLIGQPFEDMTLVALKGNHDAIMVMALSDPAGMGVWMKKGGGAALASYGGVAAAVPESHIDWLDDRPLLYRDDHRVYVHAGVDLDVPLAMQPEKTLLWKRYAKGDPRGYGQLHVVHGHDNAPEGPLLFEGRSNLDACAWRTGRLVVGVFDDDRPGGPVDFIVVKAEA